MLIIRHKNKNFSKKCKITKNIKLENHKRIEKKLVKIYY